MSRNKKRYENKYLFIDGYNLLNQWALVKNNVSLEDARKELIDKLVDYSAYKNEKTILVFDAYQVKSLLTKIEKYNDLEIVYTKEHQTADSYIEIEVTKLAPDPRNYIRVVTGDWAQQQMILGSGALRMTANEFLMEMMRIKSKIKDSSHVEVEKTTFEDVLTKELYNQLKKIKDE